MKRPLTQLSVLYTSAGGDAYARSTENYGLACSALTADSWEPHLNEPSRTFRSSGVRAAAEVNNASRH